MAKKAQASQRTETPQQQRVAIELEDLCPQVAVPLDDAGSKLLAKGSSAFDTGDEETLEELHVTSCARVGSAEFTITDSLLLEHRLCTLSALLQSEAEDFAAELESRKQQIDGALESNLKKVFTEQRDLEVTYRNLDLFYARAPLQAGQGLPVKLFIANVDDLRRNRDLFDNLAGQLPKSSRFAMKDLPSLLVLPGWLRSPAALENFGTLALETKSQVLTGWTSGSLDEATGQFDTGVFAGVKGTEHWKEQICIVANDPMVRRRNRYEDETLGDVYASAAMLFAAEVFRGDEQGHMGVAQVNRPLNILGDGGEMVTTLRWNDLDDKEVAARFQRCVICLVKWTPQEIHFWDVSTLSEDRWGRQYQIRRVLDYIDKVLLHYLNLEAFKPNTPAGRQSLFDKLQEFFRGNVGDEDDRLLQEGEVLCVEESEKDPAEVEIKISIKPKYATERYNVEYIAKEDQGKFQIEAA